MLGGNRLKAAAALSANGKGDQARALLKILLAGNANFPDRQAAQQLAASLALRPSAAQ